jgi:hypothetical protein
MQIAGLHTTGQRFRLDNKINAPAAFWITPPRALANHFPAFARPRLCLGEPLEI